MESKATVVCLILVILGIISAAFGIGAEVTRVKASQVTLYIYGPFASCDYPSSPAMGLAIGAILALFLSRVVLVAATGSGTCCFDNRLTSPFARICATISWVTKVVALVLLVAGAALNNRRGVQVTTDGYYVCYVVKPGVFAAGAVLSLATVFMGLMYFVTVSSLPKDTATPGTAPPVGMLPPGTIAVAPPAGGAFDLEKQPPIATNNIPN